MKCSFLQGLPTAAFDKYILFIRGASSLKRRPGFPSYSWTGWLGRVEWATFGTHPLDRRPDIQNDWLAKSTWIEWWKRSPSGVVDLVWDPAANEAWKTAVSSDVGYCRRNGFKSKYCIGLDCSQIRPSGCLPSSFKSPPLEYSILQFWTLSIRMA
jgi:hypothetical protein